MYELSGLESVQPPLHLVQEIETIHHLSGLQNWSHTLQMEEGFARGASSKVSRCNRRPSDEVMALGAFGTADEIQADETHEGIPQSSGDPSRGQSCRSRLSGALLGLLPPLGSDPRSVIGRQSLPHRSL